MKNPISVAKPKRSKLDTPPLAVAEELPT